MLQPSFRFLIVPLGAICTIATLASQNAPQTAQRSTIAAPAQERLVDCGARSRASADICVISESVAR